MEARNMPLGILRRIFDNARHPRGPGAGLFLRAMNVCHSPLSKWGLGYLDLVGGGEVLDLGCGGGKNIRRMLKASPRVRVCGLDCSEASVGLSRRLNWKAIQAGRSEIKLGSVERIPWPDGSFDVATAFETVYFWPDWSRNFQEVRRVLRPGGLFLVCNSLVPWEGGQGPGRFWVDLLDLGRAARTDFRALVAGSGFGDVEDHRRGRRGYLLKAYSR
jgi:SAM-dependent methyltransferase